MVSVELFIKGDDGHCLYVSESVGEFLLSRKKKDSFGKIVYPDFRMLQLIANGGFQVDQVHIRWETKKTQRIAISSTLRIIGFRDGPNFIGIDWFKKKGGSYTKKEMNRVERVLAICLKKEWCIRKPGS